MHEISQFYFQSYGDEHYYHPLLPQHSIASPSALTPNNVSFEVIMLQVLGRSLSLFVSGHSDWSVLFAG